MARLRGGSGVRVQLSRNGLIASRRSLFCGSGLVSRLGRTAAPTVLRPKAAPTRDRARLRACAAFVGAGLPANRPVQAMHPSKRPDCQPHLAFLWERPCVAIGLHSGPRICASCKTVGAALRPIATQGRSHRGPRRLRVCVAFVGAGLPANRPAQATHPCKSTHKPCHRHPPPAGRPDADAAQTAPASAQSWRLTAR